MALTYQQAKEIKETIPILREHGEEITSLFYQNMIRDHPELNNYFNSVNQMNGRQPRALTAVILHFACNISHTSELIPKLERVCNKHCSLGIKPEHYEIVGKYLIEAFSSILGPGMTPEVHAAWMKAYWTLAKMLIGREAQLYKGFQKWTGWRKFKIDRKVAESDDIWSFHLVPADGESLPSFLPGQYISVQVQSPALGYLQSRQYALSDAPRTDHYRISIKRDQGSQHSNSASTCHFNAGIVSNFLIDSVSDGDMIDISHPTGEFYLDTNNPSSVPLVLISAGVGVAPLMSILNTVMEAQPGREISWIYGSRKAIPFEDHLSQAKRRLGSNFRTNIFKTDLATSELAGVHGNYDFRMDLAKVNRADLFLNHSGTEYFICGPEQFMMEMNDYLLDIGVNASRVKYGFLGTGDLVFKH